MTRPPKLENKILLTLLKEPLTRYNASSLAQHLGSSREAANKACKNLKNNNLIIGETLGKAIFYHLNKKSEYLKARLKTLLFEETLTRKRWQVEFQQLYPLVQIATLFGSTARKNEGNDIDLLLVFKKENNTILNRTLAQRQKFLSKKIHPIKQTMKDIRENVQKEDKALLNAIKESVILHGHDNFIELMYNVARKE